MKKKQILWIAVGAVVLIALVVAAAFLWKGLSADPVEESKTLTFTVVDKDGVAEEHNITTEAEYLADALAEAGFVEYSADGKYTVVDGITADWEKDRAYWKFTENGRDMSRGLNDQPILNFDRYEATYTISE